MSAVTDYITTLEKALDVAEGTETFFDPEEKAKARRVATAAGARRFGAPIGSIIRADGSIVGPDGRESQRYSTRKPAAKKPSSRASVFKPGDIVGVGGGDARYEVVKIDGDDVHLKNVDEGGRGGKRVLKASQLTPIKKTASSAPDRVRPSSASSAKMGKKKSIDGWEVYPVRIGSDEYGITNDGNGWYPYKGEHDYIGNDYYDSPKEALEALENWHGDQKAKSNRKKGK